LSCRRCVYLYRTRKSKSLLRVRLHSGLKDSDALAGPRGKCFPANRRVHRECCASWKCCNVYLRQGFSPRRHKARSGIATPDRANLFQSLAEIKCTSGRLRGCVISHDCTGIDCFCRPLILAFFRREAHLLPVQQEGVSPWAPPASSPAPRLMVRGMTSLKRFLIARRAQRRSPLHTD
jgi:hypothetical protein